MPSNQGIVAVERRVWWPDAFVDEVMPEGRSTPDAWLCRLNDGAHAIQGDEPNGLAPIMLAEGQEVLFTYCDDLGTSRVLVGALGEVVWDPDPPAAANHFWCGNDPDTISDTPAMFGEWLREYGDPPEICCLSYWGDQHVRCRFTAQDGPPRFVALDALPGEPAGEVEAPPYDDEQDDLLSPTGEAA